MFPVFVQLLGLILSFENAHVIGGLPDRLAGLPLPEGTPVVVSYIRRDNLVLFWRA